MGLRPIGDMCTRVHTYRSPPRRGDGQRHRPRTRALERAATHDVHALSSGLYQAIDLVRRGGTISLSGVYAGRADPLPMLTLFDKQIHLRMGQAHVWRWVAALLPLVTEGDSWASTTSPSTGSP